MIRRLNGKDKEYLDLLVQLTDVGTYTDEKWLKTFESIEKQENIEIYVLIDQNTEKICAAGTLLIEQKFIHDGSRVAHIEDVIVRKEIRGSGYGTSIIKHLQARAREVGAYKVVLSCNSNNIEFYKKLDFYANETEMRYDIKSE